MTWPLSRKRRDAELARELDSYVDEEAARLIADGIPPEAARRAAARRLGNTARLREEVFESSPLAFFDALRQDVRYGARQILRHPGLAAAAIASLALALGANVFVFSIADTLVLAPLRVPQPEEVVFLRAAPTVNHSFPTYLELRDRNDTFEQVAGYRLAPMSLEQPEGATRIWGYLATGNYFETFDVEPEIGRFFNAEEEADADQLIVLSHDTWLSRFHGDRGVIGRTIDVNRMRFTIVGVAPEGFYGADVFLRPAVWLPMTMQPQIEARESWLGNHNTKNTSVVGRLKDGVATAQAEANLNAIAAVLELEHPEANRGLSVTVTRPGLDALGIPARSFTLGILVLAGIVLLTGCANLAGILVSRGADRQREMALRVSIGAGRGRLLRQVITETLLLSFVGGIVGIALAWLALDALSALQAPIDVPAQLDALPDTRVALFALAATLFAGVLAGVVPARHASRTAPQTAMKDAGAASVGGRRIAVRDVLVVAQLALCVALVSASLVALRGLRELLDQPLGLQREGAAVVAFELGLAGYDTPRGRDLQRRALEAVQRIPGVDAAAYGNSLPLSIDQSTATVFGERNGVVAEEPQSAVYYLVSPGYFRALGTRMISGRDFDWTDNADRPRVAIVNQVFARQVFGTTDAIGLRFRYGRTGAPTEVVGIVEDGKYRSLAEDPMPVIFRPSEQSYNSTTTLVARSSLPADQLVPAMRSAMSALDPRLPLYAASSLSAVLDFALLPARAAAIALSAFGVLALALAITGLHGLVAYGVAKRRRELGVRIALGATSGQVVSLVGGRVLLLTGIGVALGLLLAVATRQILATVVYNVSPLDPGMLGGVVAIMAVASMAACIGPALRALRTDPITALRSD